MPEDPAAGTASDPQDPNNPTGGETDPAGGEDQAAALEALAQLLKDKGLKPEQVAGRLDASRKWEQRAKSNADAAQRLAELERTNMSEAEKIAEAQIRAVEAELQLSRYKVAADKSLPANAAQFLYGDDEDEIAAAADDLIAFAKAYTAAGTPTTTAPDLKQGRRGGGAPPTADDGNAYLRSLRRRS